jgi:hypothetical protein
MIDMEKRRASWRRYNTSPLGQDRAWRYRQTPLYQEAKRRYVESPKGQDTAWRYEHDNLDRQARNNRHTPAARERDQIKRRRKVRELAADNPFFVRDAAQYRLAQANRGKAINGRSSGSRSRELPAVRRYKPAQASFMALSASFARAVHWRRVPGGQAMMVS